MYYKDHDEMSKLLFATKYLRLCLKCRGKDDESTPKQADLLDYLDKNESDESEFGDFKDKNAIVCNILYNYILNG